MLRKTIFGLSSLLALAVVTAVYAWHSMTKDLPSKQTMSSVIRSQSDQYGSDVYDRNKIWMGQYLDEYRIHTPIAQLRPQTIAAFTSAEDKDFFTHPGFSLIALVRAGIINVLTGRYAQGASTITQQTIRSIFLSNEKTLLRKFKELILSRRLESIFKKMEILEIYLNRVYFGRRAYGIEAASRVYFGKNAKDLSIGESAFLAGLLKAPSYYARKQNFSRALARQRAVLLRMYKNKKLSLLERDFFLEKGIKFAEKSRTWSKQSSYALDLVARQVGKIFSHNHTKTLGLQITSTIDKGMQDKLERLIKGNSFRFKGNKFKRGLQIACLSLINSTGEILAVSGGSDYHETQFNRATETVRPIGNMIAPIMYAFALENGYQLNSFTSRGQSLSGLPSFYKSIFSLESPSTARLISSLGHKTLEKQLSSVGLELSPNSFENFATPRVESSLLKMALAFSALFNGGNLFPGRVLHHINRRESARPLILAKTDQPRKVFSESSSNVVSLAMTAGSIRSRSPREGDEAIFWTVTKDEKNIWAVIKSGVIIHSLWIGSEMGQTNVTDPAYDIEHLVYGLSKALIDLQPSIPVSRQLEKEKVRAGVSFGRISIGGGGNVTVPFHRI